MRRCRGIIDDAATAADAAVSSMDSRSFRARQRRVIVISRYSDGMVRRCRLLVQLFSLSSYILYMGIVSMMTMMMTLG